MQSLGREDLTCCGAPSLCIGKLLRLGSRAGGHDYQALCVPEPALLNKRSSSHSN